MRIGSIVSVVLGASFLVGCGFREVAPPEVPRAEIPRGAEERTSAPEAGTTRVLLDANGEKATVIEVVDSSTSIATAKVGTTTATAFGYSETTKPICLAPCFVDLKPGAHVLRFASPTDDERVSQTAIQVGDTSKVVRHAVGRSETSVAHRMAMMLVYVGVGTAAAGGAVWFADAHSSHPSADGSALGMGFTAGGLGALAIGIPLALLTQPVHQAGSTTEMPLPR